MAPIELQHCVSLLREPSHLVSTMAWIFSSHDATYVKSASLFGGKDWYPVNYVL